MTLPEIVELILEDDEELNAEFPNTTPAMTALVTSLALMRSSLQREIATSEGIAASVEKWKEFYGQATPESVRNWVAQLGEKMRSIPIPLSYVLEVASADEDCA